MITRTTNPKDYPNDHIVKLVKHYKDTDGDMEALLVELFTQQTCRDQALMRLNRFLMEDQAQYPDAGYGK